MSFLHFARFFVFFLICVMCYVLCGYELSYIWVFGLWHLCPPIPVMVIWLLTGMLLSGTFSCSARWCCSDAHALCCPSVILVTPKFWVYRIVILVFPVYAFSVQASSWYILRLSQVYRIAMKPYWPVPKSHSPHDSLFGLSHMWGLVQRRKKRPSGCDVGDHGTNLIGPTHV